MQPAPNSLPNNIKQLKALLLEEQTLLTQKDDLLKQKDTEIANLKLRYQHILEQFRLAQHKQFGKSSEVSVDQLALFNEAEQIQDDISAAEQAATIDAAPTSAITRNRPKRQPLPKDLPREIVIHDINDADKVCGCCGGALHKMGEEKSEQLEFIPAQIKVIEHIRPQYSCRQCEQTGIKTDIQIAPVPPSPIPKSFATPSLLAQIISSPR